MSYEKAGVNIDKGNEAVERIKASVKKTFRPECLTDIGGFGGLFALHTSGMKEPVLVSGTDGVGTKLKYAFETGIHNTIGIDCVAMCVNDIVVSGAEPLFFLDYLAVGQLEPARVEEIVSGVAQGCLQAGCALIGGETAEMPGFYEQEEYDIAGFAVGIVDKQKIIDGTQIAENDVVIGLPSSGFHSNGYSLVRAIYPPSECDEDKKKRLLAPTKIYVRPVLDIVKEYPGKVHGMAHITGGGITENIPRVLHRKWDCVLKKSLWRTLPLFTEIQKDGHIAEEEMRRTFNMGVGFVLIVARESADEMLRSLDKEGAYRIGEIQKGSGQVRWID